MEPELLTDTKTDQSQATASVQCYTEVKFGNGTLRENNLQQPLKLKTPRNMVKLVTLHCICTCDCCCE